MNSKEYVAGVLKTESKPEKINFGPVSLHALLGLMINTANLADMAKKAIFYGDKKPIDQVKFHEAARNIGYLSNFFQSRPVGELSNLDDRSKFVSVPFNMKNTDGVNKRLLHVGIGVFTEAGEILEALLKSWETGDMIDRVNLGEELGDVHWYLGVGSDELNIPFEVLFEQNNTKLLDKKAGRYKQGSFDVDAALNRTLGAERGLLEGSLKEEAEQRGRSDAELFGSKGPTLHRAARRFAPGATTVGAEGGEWELPKSGEVEMKASGVSEGCALATAIGADGKTYASGFVPAVGQSMVIDPLTLKPKYTINAGRNLVSTQNPHIFYNPATEQFDLFDESALLHDSYDSFNEALQRQEEYVKSLNDGK